MTMPEIRPGVRARLVPFAPSSTQTFTTTSIGVPIDVGAGEGGSGDGDNHSQGCPNRLVVGPSSGTTKTLSSSPSSAENCSSMSAPGGSVLGDLRGKYVDFPAAALKDSVTSIGSSGDDSRSSVSVSVVTRKETMRFEVLQNPSGSSSISTRGALGVPTLTKRPNAKSSDWKS